MGKLFVAILLLLSTLSSNPLGSMEQSVPEPGIPLAHATALPLVRAPAAELRGPLDLAPEPSSPPLHPASAAPAELEVRGSYRPPVLPAAREAAISLLERLPYFATAPPPPPLPTA